MGLNNVQAQMPSYVQYKATQNQKQYQTNLFNPKLNSPLNSDTVSFTSDVDKNKQIDKKRVKVYTCEASTSKKWGVGIASFFIPGLGQAINGDWIKGAAFFTASIALSLAQMYMPTACSAARLGTKIWSIIDAVKNAKSEIKTVE